MTGNLNEIVIGSRGSALALVQAESVARSLEALHPGLRARIEIIVTSGDRSQKSQTPLGQTAEKGVFAKEIEAALLQGDIDIAVHSMKDLPALLPAGLAIAATPAREDCRDAALGSPLENLRSGAKVGASSARRAALISQMRPDLVVAPIRGNIDTRIDKLKRGDFDAIVLAAAGLSRLGRLDEIAQYLNPEIFIPAPGQGALAVEIRSDDRKSKKLVQGLNDPDAADTAACERACLAALGGGCSAPVGIWAQIDSSSITLRAMMFSSIRKEILRIKTIGNRENLTDLGKRAAELLRNMENSASV